MSRGAIRHHLLIRQTVRSCQNGATGHKVHGISVTLEIITLMDRLRAQPVLSLPFRYIQLSRRLARRDFQRSGFCQLRHARGPLQEKWRNHTALAVGPRCLPTKERLAASRFALKQPFHRRGDGGPRVDVDAGPLAVARAPATRLATRFSWCHWWESIAFLHGLAPQPISAAHQR